MIVAFLPSELAGTTDDHDGGVEAVAHVQFALEDTRKCLKTMPVETRMVFAEQLIIQDGKNRTRIRIPTQTGKSIGAYLLTPGRKACVVYATAGPSSLLVLLPAAAAEYFHAPGCADDSVQQQCGE